MIIIYINRIIEVITLIHSLFIVEHQIHLYLHIMTIFIWFQLIITIAKPLHNIITINRFTALLAV